MNARRRPSDWARLFRIARGLIEQVNSEHLIVDEWSFGGGTAMMIQVDHRESHDVDIFIRDPQLLAYLDPQKHDFVFEQLPNAYRGDGTGFVKLSFECGEIDFIVGQPMSPEPVRWHEIEGAPVRLETVAEIIAKKIVYRGGNIKPRDIFDIAVAAEDADAIRVALAPHRHAVEATLDRLDRLNSDFVSAAIDELMIRERLLPMAATALARATEFLRSI